MSRTRSRALTAAAPLFAAVALVGCSDESPSASPSAGPSAAQSAAPSAAPPAVPSTAPSAAAELSSVPMLGVSDVVASAYDEAVSTMSAALQQTGAEIVAAQQARDVEAARAGAQRMRDVIFAFDAEVRRLDLSAVQPQVDELFAQDGAMLARLDALQQAFTPRQVAQRVNRLPTDAYIAAFQAVADAIDATRS